MVIIFYIFLLASCGYACWHGGRTELWGSLIFISAAVASSLFTWDTRWLSTDFSLAAIDTLCLVGLYLVAIRSACYWPIWAAGFQLLSVLAHAADFLDPRHPALYRSLETVWALPALGSMMIGVMTKRWANERARSHLASSGEAGGSLVPIDRE